MALALLLAAPVLAAGATAGGLAVAGGGLLAAGGGGLLAAAERAPVTVVGRAGEPVRLDLHGWAADFTVERALSGPHGAGTSLRVAWEELASDATPRLHPGEPVLLALEPLPDWSLWRERLPGGGALGIAGRGTALLRAPDRVTVERLAAHLAGLAGPAGRASAIDSLTGLVRDAHPQLASEAVERLGREPDLDGVDADARADLEAALRDGARPPALRRALLALAGARRLAFLRPAVADLAREGPPLMAPALDALARLDGGLAPERVRSLLAHEDGDVRAVAVRHAADMLDLDALSRLLGGDPSADVRSEVVVALLALPGDAPLEAACAALFDAEPLVRASAARHIGRVGARAVPLLRKLALGRGSPEATGPLAALAEAGPEGRGALAEIAAVHDDERVRKLARVALGKPLESH